MIKLSHMVHISLPTREKTKITRVYNMVIMQKIFCRTYYANQINIL